MKILFAQGRMMFYVIFLDPVRNFPVFAEMFSVNERTEIFRKPTENCISQSQGQK